MTIEEKRNRIEAMCCRTVNCYDCPLNDVVGDGEFCYTQGADIEKNYAVLFGDKSTDENAAPRHEHWEDKIYQWGKGDDAVGDEVLCALNNIIRGLFTIDSIDGGFSGLLDRLNVSTDYHKMVMEFDADIDLADLACRFEVVRTLLFGSKINYDFLNDHLHKAAQERKEKRQ